MRLSVLLLLVFTISLSSCGYMGDRRVRGNGTASTQQRQVGSFSGVEVQNDIDVYLSQDATSSLKIEGDENLLPYIDITNNGDVLKIRTRQGYNLSPRAGLKIYISAPSFNKLSVAGSGTIKSQTKITNTTGISTEVGGSGDIQLELDAPTVTADVAGSGNIILSGNTRSFKGSIAGSGDIKCFNLMSETANIDVAGSGNAQVFASKQLSVEIAGSGDVHYKGSPSVNQSVIGSGSVTKAG